MRGSRGGVLGVNQTSTGGTEADGKTHRNEAGLGFWLACLGWCRRRSLQQGNWSGGRGGVGGRLPDRKSGIPPGTYQDQGRRGRIKKPRDLKSRCAGERCGWGLAGITWRQRSRSSPGTPGLSRAGGGARRSARVRGGSRAGPVLSAAAAACSPKPAAWRSEATVPP